MIKVEGKEIADYRKEIENRKSDLPIWERKVLTCDEAAAYSGIGIARLRSMTMRKRFRRKNNGKDKKTR